MRVIEDVSDEMADVIPEGFRNNIRWQLGHIYFVNEAFAFYYNDLPMHGVKGFKEWFSNGTTPLDWVTEPPSMKELRDLLEGQQERIQSALTNRLEEETKQKFTTGSGFALETTGEFLNFNLYHEGMHVSVIKIYKSLIQK